MRTYFYLRAGKNSFHILYTLCLAFGVVGCGTEYRTADIINTSKPYAESWKSCRFSIQQGDEDYFINPYTYNPAAARSHKNSDFIADRSQSLYSQALDSGHKDQAKLARNTLQEAIIGVEMNETKQHLAAIKATQNSANIILGATAIGLTGGSSVAAGATARALAAAATGVTAGRELYNNQTYRDALVESLIGAIISDQQNFHDNYIIPKQKLPIDRYPVTAAINDAVEYGNHGSFYYGLQLIRNDIDVASSNRTNSPAQAKGLKSIGAIK